MMRFCTCSPVATRMGAMACAIAACPRISSGLAAWQVQRFTGSQGIADVAEIDAGDKLLRRHIGEQLPERLALNLGPQVPDRVNHSGGSQVHSSLLRSDPAQLTVTGDIAPEGAHISRERLQGASGDERGQRPYGGDANLVSTSDGKGHA